MEMKYQPATEEELIAFISESMDPFEAAQSATASSASAGTEDDGYENWTHRYISEEEVARENGCWIDDDGHWIPMDNDNDWF